MVVSLPLDDRLLKVLPTHSVRTGRHLVSLSILLLHEIPGAVSYRDRISIAFQAQLALWFVNTLRGKWRERAVSVLICKPLINQDTLLHRRVVSR